MEKYLNLEINQSIDLVIEGNVATFKIGTLYRKSEDLFILTWNNKEQSELSKEDIKNKIWLGKDFDTDRQRGVYKKTPQISGKILLRKYLNTISSYRDINPYTGKSKKGREKYNE